jgi:hypothetical protein
MNQTRRLATDVVRYWRLMGTDEEGTLERMHEGSGKNRGLDSGDPAAASLSFSVALRSSETPHRELVDPKTERRGRIVKTTGDGLPQCGLLRARMAVCVGLVSRA